MPGEGCAVLPHGDVATIRKRAGSPLLRRYGFVKRVCRGWTQGTWGSGPDVAVPERDAVVRGGFRWLRPLSCDQECEQRAPEDQPLIRMR